MIKKILSSNIIHFVVTRYLGYGIQFLNTLLLAKYLGAYYLGVYGFLTLFLQYLSYGNFGVHYALNFYLSTKKSKELTGLIYSNTIILSGLFSLLIFGAFFFMKFFDIQIFSKYSFDTFYIFIGLIAILQFTNQLFINIYRTYGILWQINFYQLIIPILQIAGFIFFQEEQLLIFIISMTLIGNLIASIVFLIGNPLKFRFKVSSKVIQSIFSKGVNLLIYNISFYLIMLSGRTLVGIFYSVEDMGQYSFGNNLSNAVIMVMGSLSFLFFSKMINKLTSLNSNHDIIQFIEKSRKLYMNLTLIISMLFFIMVPFLVSLLPQYGEAFKIFKILLIAQIIISNSFGYTTLLIAKKKEFSLTEAAIITTVINLLLGGGVLLFDLSIEYIAFATFLSAIYYNIKSVIEGNRITEQFRNIRDLLSYIFPIDLFIILLLMVFSILFDNVLISVFGLLIYTYWNFQELKKISKYGFEKILNKNSLNL